METQKRKAERRKLPRKPEPRKLLWKELADLQRAMVPAHIIFPVTHCENCGHPLSRHYSYTNGIARVACSGGKCPCQGIKIQGKLIDEFVPAERSN